MWRGPARSFSCSETAVTSSASWTRGNKAPGCGAQLVGTGARGGSPRAKTPRVFGEGKRDPLEAGEGCQYPCSTPTSAGHSLGAPSSLPATPTPGTPRALTYSQAGCAQPLRAPRVSGARNSHSQGGLTQQLQPGRGWEGVSPLLEVTQKAPKGRASRCALEPQTERAAAGLGTEPARGGPGAGRGGPRRGDGSRAHTPQP